jgi:zinc protease
MTRRFSLLGSLALTLLVAAAPTPPSSAAELPKTILPEVKRWVLPNGLQVIFIPDHKAPAVAVQVFYHVGGKDEPADKRGIAHMFEHMMFKGSKHVPPEEHARFIDAVGGEENAFTSDDLTAYHETIPPNALDFSLKLEAERMRNLLLTQKTIDSEREVVKEELRLRLENSPVTQALDKVLHLAFEKHPYRQMPIGEKKMLDTVTVEDCKNFYNTFYQPNNATLIVIGDTDEPTVRKLVDGHFGPIPRGPHMERRREVVEPPQVKMREATLTMPVQVPVVIGAYHVPNGRHDDLYALHVLQEILSSGESSRMYRRLVRKDRLAVAAGGFVFDREDPGLFVTYAAFFPTVDAHRVKAAIEDEIRRVSTERLDPKELEKAKNQLASRAAFGREKVANLATQLGHDQVVIGDALHTFSAPTRYDAVTADEVLRVAQTYLRPENQSVVTLVPKRGGQP